MDIRLVWDPVRARGDWEIANGDLATDADGIETAVLLSLFTDRRAPPGYVPPPGGPTSLRGHWSDTYEAEPAGSLLWTLDRSKTGGADVPATARDMIADALGWMVRAGVVTDVAPSAGWAGAGVLRLGVAVTLPSRATQTLSYDWDWSA